ERFSETTRFLFWAGCGDEFARNRWRNDREQLFRGTRTVLRNNRRPCAGNRDCPRRRANRENRRATRLAGSGTRPNRATAPPASVGNGEEMAAGIDQALAGIWTHAFPARAKKFE